MYYIHYILNEHTYIAYTSFEKIYEVLYTFIDVGDFTFFHLREIVTYIKLDKKVKEGILYVKRIG